MPYILGEKQSTAWVRHDEYDLELLLQLITDSKRAELLKKNTTIINNEEIIDHKSFAEDYLDYCILDWKKVIDKNKKKVPCTRENKIIIYDSDQKLFDWIGFNSTWRPHFGYNIEELLGKLGAPSNGAKKRKQLIEQD